MEEFLLGLLMVVLETFAEFLLEVAIVGLLDVFLRAVARVFESLSFTNALFAWIWYATLGAALGGLSLVIFPHPLVHPSRFHGMNLLVSPIATGLAMFLVGSILRSKGCRVTRIESFAYGFALAFGVALVRHFFAA